MLRWYRRWRARRFIHRLGRDLKKLDARLRDAASPRHARRRVIRNLVRNVNSARAGLFDDD